LAINTVAWVVVAEAIDLEFVKYVLFCEAAVLFAMTTGVEVLEITVVVAGDVAGAVVAVGNRAIVVVFRATDDVDSGIVADDIVELL